LPREFSEKSLARDDGRMIGARAPGMPGRYPAPDAHAAINCSITLPRA